MGEEEVRIPVKMEVDSSDLQELKSEVDKTFKQIHEYENKRSTKKDPWNVKGVSEYESQVNDLLDKMKQLQTLFEAESQKTPFSDLKQVQASIGEQIKANAQTQKEISAEYMRSLSYANQVKKSDEELARIKKEQRDLQRQYNKDVKSVSTGDKGANSQLKAIRKQYELQRRQLEEQKAAAESRRNIDQQMADQAMERSQTAKATYEEGQRVVAGLREQASSIGRITKQEGYTQRFEEQRRNTLEGINRQLREMEELVTNIQYASQKSMQQDIKDTGYQTPREKATSKVQAQARKEEEHQAREMAKLEKDLERERAKTVQAVQKEERDAERAVAKAHREAEAATKAQIMALNQEKAAIKQSAAQYYYKLRSIKMLGHVIGQANVAVTNFGKNAASFTGKALNAYMRLIPGVNSLRKALDKTNTSHKKLNREIKNTTKSHEGFNISLKKGLTTILKYSLGIRSLYVLFNKMRAAMIDGLGQLAVKYSDVNTQMSSIISSINQMKAAVTSVVQPLLNILAPALEKVAQLVADIAYKVASFMAALTGQSYVYKATRLQTDYAASLDKTAKSAKEATKELGKYDKLNVIHQDKDSGSDDGGVGTMGFEKVPIDSTMADWAKKFKEFLDRLLGPIKKAWKKMRKFVIDAWKYMLNELLALGKSVAEAFWRVWEEPETQKIFENIFKILGDIFLIIGNIARALRIAWEHNDNGYRTLKAIRDIILIITDGIMRAADYTVEWSKNLSFIPLFDTLADNLEQKIVPAVQKIVDLLVIVYEQIFLKLVKDFIEKGLPQIVDILGTVGETVGIIAEKIRIAIQSGSNGIAIVTRFENLLQIVADAIQYCAEKTKEWAEDLDFRPLLISIKNFLEDIEPLVQFLVDTFSAFWTDVLLPFWKYLAEEGGPTLLDGLSESLNKVDWEKLTADMNNLMPALEGFFELAWDVLAQVILDISNALADFANSDTLTIIIDKFREWVENADPEELAHKLETAVVVFIEVKAALELLSKVIMPVVTGFMTLGNALVQSKMASEITKISKEDRL